ncbi:restriction endonuclease subunit S [Staphylococcus epidermidis]|uniref:restriction endonuclease subunit S n=1 Tax=Staphylococcus epidermidis TaxID=1282 RepID=UPI000C261AC9|nr:restriction endonuclease subunit S [Staphylococcus epidermidis]PJM38930.1 restriction endonuclease subunit S [Staphylococcus epidermidis]PJM50352.1 restriction endonuclease subunit S [Staphylococcus epidermidis]PJM53900.1 restriction endonuclease subunit S [Staphylococcus epidermidis]PJM60269.1 restriction endonuclease subunit S [Staphylococcus epidermidis]
MEFKEYKLADITEKIYSGGTPSTKEASYWNGELKWLSSGETSNRFIISTEKNITQKGVENSSTKLAFKNDLVMASAGQGYTRGQTSFLKIDTYINQSLIAISVNKDKVHPLYLFYNLISRYAELRQISDSSSTRGSINTKMIKNLNIMIPEKSHQNRIVYLINSIDEKIEINKKIIANLEELSQTLFKRWFVDFEFPDEDGNPYKSSGGEMVSSELGKIPENWRIKTINNLLTINSGYAFKSKWWSDIGYDVIKIKDINNNSIDINNLDKVNKDYINKAANFKVWGGEIVIALTGATAGKMGIVPKLKEVAFVNQRVGLVNSEINNVYIYNLLRSDRLRRLTLEEAIGSAQPNISPIKFGNIKVVCPSKKIINQYCQLLKHSYQKIVELYGENNYLIQLRDTLLPKLMSGELEIPDDMEVNMDELSI